MEFERHRRIVIRGNRSFKCIVETAPGLSEKCDPEWFGGVAGVLEVLISEKDLSRVAFRTPPRPLKTLSTVAVPTLAAAAISASFGPRHTHSTRFILILRKPILPQSVVGRNRLRLMDFQSDWPLFAVQHLISLT